MAGATTIEVNGVPVSATAPLPVQLQTGGTVGDVNAKQWGGAALGAGVGAVAAQTYATVRALVDTVLRGDDGATYSAIRSGNNTDNQQSTSLVRLLTDSVMRGTLVEGSNADPIQASRVISGSQGSALTIMPVRGFAFETSRKGRRFTAKSPNLTGVAATTALTTTTPTYLLVNGLTNECVVRRIVITLPVVGTSTSFRLLVKTDTADRFSAGGTTRTPVTMNNGNVVAATQARSLEAPTATAEGGGTRDVAVRTGSVISGGQIVYEPEDGLVIAASGSLLFYVITGTAAATVDYEIEYEDVNIQ